MTDRSSSTACFTMGLGGGGGGDDAGGGNGLREGGGFGGGATLPGSQKEQERQAQRVQ